MNKKVRAYVGLAIISLLVSGCSSSSAEESTSVPTPQSSKSSASESSSSSANVTPELPGEWSSDELKIWNLFSQIHPEVKIINLAGKRALLDMTHNICEAYDEGFSRVEIASVMNSRGSSDAAFNDDLMTLGVTYFCPQHMSKQLN